MTTKRHDELTEVAALLAAALWRLRDRKSTQISPHVGNSPLDFAAVSDGDVGENTPDLRL
jgi:hypothetical protein